MSRYSETNPADSRRDAFRERIEALWPLAKGSVSEVRKPCTRPGCKACASGQKHPALIFTYRKDGKLRCRHVRPGQEASYYIYVTYPDGRHSENSNTVTVKAPKEK